MEQHPVPQNVTSFEFKLIGDMTLKQFAYLAAGCIAGYLTFKVPFVPALFRIPLGGFWVLFGVALAFFPLEERPLDRWISAFFARVYQPTQYIWKKTATPPELLTSLISQPPVATVRIQPSTFQPQLDRIQVSEFIATLPSKTPTAGVQPIDFLRSAHPPAPRSQPPPSPLPHTSPGVPPQSLTEEKTQQLSSRIAQLQKELGSRTISQERFLELQKELTALITEKETLLQRLVDLRQDMDSKKSQEVVRPTQFAQDENPQQQTVKLVPPSLGQKKGIPYLTTIPNVVTGIVKTAEGEFLPNILLTVKDKKDMPMRALKTNKLGQFASSSPLADGIYRIEVEDLQKKYQFDVVEIALTGGIIPPLEISAKSKRDLLRAQLHKELFGTQEL